MPLLKHFAISPSDLLFRYPSAAPDADDLASPQRSHNNSKNDANSNDNDSVHAATAMVIGSDVKARIQDLFEFGEDAE